MTISLNAPADVYKVLIVDDDEDTHAISRMALSQFTFRGRPIRLFHAKSASEAFIILCEQLDMAVALVDVVMETPEAGLALVQRVRDELGNSVIRLILRTGAPGRVPELEIMARYGINDYREKGDLTASKLRTALHAALGAYVELSEAFAARSRQMFDIQEIRTDIKAMVAHIDGASRDSETDVLTGICSKLDKLLSEYDIAATSTDLR